MTTILGRLNQRIKELTALTADLASRNATLEAENRDLHDELERTRGERDSARLDSEYLTVSHRLADNPDTIIETRRHIARLIRNIDRCLEMLNE